MSEQVFPASLAQQRIWLLEQLVPGTTAYNLVRVFRLVGQLDRAALLKAINSIIARHESLRTIFVTMDDEVGQVVLPSSNLELPITDLRNLSADQRQETALQIAREEAGSPFDLRQGPLLRAKLVRLDSEEHLLIVVIHHIIVDGWSMNLLLHEMGELYGSNVTGKEPKLPELRLQYSDFSRWQRTSLTPESLADGLGYWKKKLHGAETVLQLPTDYPRPAMAKGSGKSIYFEISQKINEKLKSFAQSENSTPFMVLLAVFQVLLGRYTLQNNLLIGSPTAGRYDVELENVIGFFVNTLVLRADLDDKSSFRKLLRQARETTLEALAHQEIPFEKVVEVLEPDRSLNRNPVFQVMFVFQNAPKQEMDIHGLVMQEIEFDSGIAKFDLTLEIVDLGDFHCTLEYDSELFDESTIQRMAGHFTLLTELVLAAPDKNLSSFSLLTSSELQRLAEWNNTGSDYPRDLCVHSAFEGQVLRTPDRLAIVDQKHQLNYREVNNLANRLARRLTERGIRIGDLVGVSLDRSVEMVVALLGILKAGLSYVPLDPAYPERRLDFLIEDSRTSIVVTTPEFSDLWQRRNVNTLTFDVVSLLAEDGEYSNLLFAPPTESQMYVIYTSGSTGQPKGVEGTHRASMNRFSWMWSAYPFVENEVCCQKTFLGFVDSIWEIFGPLLRGISSVILPDEAIIDPERIVELLSQYGVTRIVLVPSLLRAILEGVGNIQSKLPNLKLWTCSGEELQSDLVNRFSNALPEAKLLNIYGSSEVAADVTWHEVTKDDRVGSVPIGKPIANVQTFILDSYMNQVPIGVPGEIYIGGDCLALGYHGKPGLTVERFISHSFEPGSSIRLFKTGDLGRYLQSGEIQYLGRTDNQIKIRGMRVELGEIEATLASHHTIRDAVVLLADRSGQQRLIAYLNVRGLHPDIDELRVYLRARLPEYMIPSGFFVVDVFPLLPSGKIDRKILATQTSAKQIGGHGRVAPETATQKSLAAIWQNLLKVDSVGVTDNFFELGGHSLMAMQVIARIRRELEVEVPIRILFEDPTINGLAKATEEAKAKGVKASASISSFLRPQNTHNQLRLEVEGMSREELEAMLRQLLNERSGAKDS